jgi:N utilization substance protein B
VGNRTKARELALQALYSLEMNPRDIQEVLRFDWVEEKQIPEEVQAYAQFLLTGTMENRPEIDQKIEAKLVRWEFNRVAKVDLSLLRLGLFQILFQEDTPNNVIIDEMIKLSKKYSSPQSYRFINGVLDNVVKELQ